MAVSAVSVTVLLSGCLCFTPQRDGFQRPEAIPQASMQRLVEVVERAITRLEDQVESDMDTYLGTMRKVLELKKGEEKKLREPGLKIVRAKFAEVRGNVKKAKTTAEALGAMRQMSTRRPAVATLLVDDEAWKKLLEKQFTEDQIAKWKTSDAAQALALPRPARANPPAIAAPVAAPMLRSAPRSGISRYASSIDRLEQTLRSTLEAELAVIDASCGLKTDQRRRLETAIKGAVKREFGSNREELSELETKFKGQENTRDAMVAASAVYQKARSYSTSPALWKKAIESTLTKEQNVSLKKEQAARRAYQLRSWAINTVWSIDQAVSLNANQRSQLEKQILAFASQGDWSWSVTKATAYHRMPEELRSICNAVLTESQKERISRSALPRSAFTRESQLFGAPGGARGGAMLQYVEEEN